MCFSIPICKLLNGHSLIQSYRGENEWLHPLGCLKKSSSAILSIPSTLHTPNHVNNEEPLRIVRVVWCNLVCFHLLRSGYCYSWEFWPYHFTWCIVHIDSPDFAHISAILGTLQKALQGVETFCRGAQIIAICQRSAPILPSFQGGTQIFPNINY